MRVRTGGATPLFTNRSHQPGYREIQAERLFCVVQELLSHVSKAARAGEVEFLAQRLDEAVRILRRLARGQQAQRTNNKQVQRAKKRSSDLRLGVVPLPTASSSPPSADSLGGQGQFQFDGQPGLSASRSQKRLQAVQRQNRQALKAAAKSRIAADLIRRSCYSCGAPGSSTTLSVKSGQAQCGKCHEKWARRRCLRCGKEWTRTLIADARRRNCPSCRPSQELFTVSAGAPSLGRRPLRAKLLPRNEANLLSPEFGLCAVAGVSP